jgi:hypothetical protein
MMVSPTALALTLAHERGVETRAIADRAAWLNWRAQDVTASAAGALLGVHEFVTPFALWHDKRGTGAPAESDAPVITDDEIALSPLARGTRLEPLAVEMLQALRPTWTVEPARHYFRMPDARIGATPDVLAIDPDRDGLGIVQIKTVGEWAASKWRDADTGGMVPPLWIAVQAIIEAELTGASWAAVGALRTGGALSLRLIDIPLHARTWARVRAEVAEFWRRVEAGEEYPPDYGRDGDLIRHLYSDDDGSEVDLSGDARISGIVAERAALKEREAAGEAAKKERAPLDAEIIHRLGNATRGRLADGSIIEAPTRRRGEFVSRATTWRALTIKKPKPRKEAAE